MCNRYYGILTVGPENKSASKSRILIISHNLNIFVENWHKLVQKIGTLGKAYGYTSNKYTIDINISLLKALMCFLYTVHLSFYLNIT